MSQHDDIQSQASYTKAELVRFFNKTDRTVQRWVNAGRIQKIRKDTYIINDKALQDELRGVLSYEQTYESTKKNEGRIAGDITDKDVKTDNKDYRFDDSDMSHKESDTVSENRHDKDISDTNVREDRDHAGAMISFNSTMMQQYQAQLQENKELLVENSILSERVERLNERMSDKETLLLTYEKTVEGRGRWAIISIVVAVIFLVALLFSINKAVLLNEQKTDLKQHMLEKEETFQKSLVGSTRHIESLANEVETLNKLILMEKTTSQEEREKARKERDALLLKIRALEIQLQASREGGAGATSLQGGGGEPEPDIGGARSNGRR